jgi:pyruvate dehydrogenase E2 component (dihydrolipoamide acetyltransferase)
LSSLRRQIAEAVALSRRTIPSFVIDRWVETAAIDRVRGALTHWTEQATGAKPTLTDFLLLALAASLSAHPRVLDRWHEDNGRVGRMRVSSVDIGLVVAIPDRVMIPALRDLAGKSIDEVAQARQDAVRPFGTAAAGRLGAGLFLAFQYWPERRRPLRSDYLSRPVWHSRSWTPARRVIGQAGGVALANGVNLTLSLDHRLIDGILGAQFIDTLAERMSRGPWSLS